MQSHTFKKKPNFPSGDYVIAIYKSKVRFASSVLAILQLSANRAFSFAQDDWEPSHQYPVSSVTDCQVQQVAHRKQGPVLPTLVISICDKEKKRRSSRAAGLISSKEQTLTTLWFRTPQDDHHRSLHEWKLFILSKKSPLSPESPASPTFINPFGNGRSNAAQSQRPSSRSRNRPNLTQNTPGHSYSSREHDRPANYNSESPSLRSKRSDISSPSSAVYANYPGLPVQGQHYTTVLPTDIPANAHAQAGPHDHVDVNAQGWVNPYGVAPPTDGEQVANSSSPPGPRETILDRAFNLRCIPGSERMIPGEEKLSSLARFDALMRDAEEKRTARETPANPPQQEVRQSAWDDDSDGNEQDEEDSDDTEEEEVYHSDEEGHYRSQKRNPRDTIIPPSAQRALEFIARRHDGPEAQSQAQPRRREQEREPEGSPVKSELEIDVDMFPIPIASPPPFRPHTSYTKRRPNMSSRTQSQPQLVPSPADVAPGPPTGGERLAVGEDATSRENRLSSSSVKRLSFTELTKRLSSTSSLLLVQTNGSGGASSGGSSEWDQMSPVPRSSLSPRGAPPNLKWRETTDDDGKRCGGWRRSSVGIFSADGSMI